MNRNPKDRKPFFRAALQPDGTLELLIYQEIGEDYWSYDGGITVKTIKDQIDRAGNYSKILMRINTPGGDVFEGIAIYNLVRAQKKPVEVYVDGLAASSGSIIAMCGDSITMGPNAMMMIHNAWAFCAGEAADMRKMADALDKISGAIAQTYVMQTKKSLDEIVAMMNAETWMTAQECLDGGFATAIASDPDEGIEQNALVMARRFKSLDRLKRVPEKLRNKAQAEVECACDCENCVEGNCSECTNPECDDPNCTDCPIQVDTENSTSNLSLFEARAKMLRLAV